MKNPKIIVALMMIICVMISAVAHYFISKECEHVDENLDHKCDLCSEAMGECADADKDHKCDYGCDKAFGTHEAADGSHGCAYCGVKLSECTPAADDGDCTTAVLCTVCEEVCTPAKSAHEAGADDGDCTTAVKCVNCDKNAVEAKPAHVAGTDDGDCTTAVKCANCDQNAVDAKPAHVAGTDDGDCTTAVKCANCDQNAVEAKDHVAGADDGDCTTAVKCVNCDQNAVAAKSHNFSGEWQKDADGHWHICQNEGCKAADTKVGHTSSGAATETEAEKCTECDYIINHELGHEHSYVIAKFDENSHWLECVCSAKSGVTAHTANEDDGNCTTAVTCTGCEYVMKAAETEHKAGEKSHNCAACGTKISECADDDKNHKCDVCEADMGIHAAADGKHTCDYCGQKASECADDDKNHKCDVCGADVGTHAAADGKHTCDYCGQKASECADDDKNHKCDVCGADMGKHEIAEGKHTCDYCGERMANCVDADANNECDVCGVKVFAYEYGMKIEAESTDFAGGSNNGNCVVEDGATGQNLGYCNGSTVVSFSVNSDAARTVELGMFASLKMDASDSPFKRDRIKVTVNGVAVDFGDETFEGTNSGNYYQAAYYRINSIAEINLVSGTNNIVITLSEYFNLDFFTLLDRNYFDGMKIEAELNENNATPQAAASGWVLSSLSSSKYVKFKVVSDGARKVTLFANALIRVDASNSANAADRFTVKVNGVAADLSGFKLNGVTHDGAGWWTKEYSTNILGMISLADGVNYIEIIPSNEMNIDYFKLDLPYTFNYENNMKIEAESTDFAGGSKDGNCVVEDGATGKNLGYTNSDTTITFRIDSDETRSVNLLMYATLRIFDTFTDLKKDRITLTVNGQAVDFGEEVFIGTDSSSYYSASNYIINNIARISLNKGINTIVVTLSEYFNLDFFALTEMDYRDGMIVEGELTCSNATLQAAGSGWILSSLSSSKYAKFEVVSDGARDVELLINALIRVDDSNSANAADRFTVKVNGVEIDLSSILLVGVTHESSAGWWTKSYTNNSLGKISLVDGVNYIEVIPSNEMNIDYFKLIDYTELPDIILQAEDAVSENVAPESAATGTVVGTRLGSKMTFTFNSSIARTANFYINAVAAVYDGYPANADGRLSVVVNGEAVDISGGTFEGMDNPDQWWKSTYNDCLLGQIELVQGENTIEVSIITTGPYGEMNIDYFAIKSE